jgi:hypothetical protein
MNVQAEELAEKVAIIVRDRDYVSFAELAREWPEHFNVRGEAYGIEATNRGENVGNIFYWTGLSAIGVKALEIGRPALFTFEPCNPLSYFIDGCALTLPLARRVRKYKEPHWLPVVLRPAGATPTKKKRRK